MDHQRFALILIVSLVGASFGAQIFTTEDRDSILKFMNVFMNFLDMETDNSTLTSTTLSPNGTTLSSNGTSLETTTLPSGNSTGVTTESSVTASNSTETTSNSTANADPSSSTTVSGNSTTTITTEATTTTVRRRICFKRYCYKFSNDKGYIV